MALVLPGRQEVVAEGALDGRIIETPRGDSGFGYDPVFDVGGRTLAEFRGGEELRQSSGPSPASSRREAPEHFLPCSGSDRLDVGTNCGRDRRGEFAKQTRLGRAATGSDRRRPAGGSLRSKLG